MQDLPPDNGLEMARIAEIYDRTAAFYDSVVAESQAAAKLAAIETLDRRRGERFLEAGVGTGWAFQRIVKASDAENAWGLDIAAGMIEVAGRRLRADAGIAYPPLLLGDVTSLPFRDGSFQCLLLTYTLEVLPSQAILPALRECLRVLRRGGRAVVLNLTPAEDGNVTMTAEWQTRFESDPEAFGGARPLRASGLMAVAGFVGVSRDYVGPDWPSEVLLGFRPA